MAIYVVTGKLGTGKSKYCVARARAAIRQGRRVASNIDLRLDKLTPDKSKARYYRLPDKPSVRDLESIGHGNPESYDEDRNGLLILDELGSWLNARQFGEKERQPVVDWLIHARKHGWDVLFIAQAIQQIDKQVREALAEYVVTCYRLDKFKIPVIGFLLDAFVSERLGRLPRFHIAVTKMSLGTSAWTVVERDFYRGDDLHEAYDTRQVFQPNPEAVTCTVLHSCYFGGSAVRLSSLKRAVSAVRAFVGSSRGRKPVVAKPKHPVVSLLMRLPESDRYREFARLQRLGVL